MKKSRTTFIIAIIIMVINIQLNAQSNDSVSNDFYSYTNIMDAYYDSLIAITPDTLKIQGLKTYERQKDFWATRVFANDSVQGSYSKYIEQLNLYAQNPALLPQLNATNTWEFVGPVDIASHNQGIIVSLHVDPDNINNIYAGTNSSGLFRTQNGGQTWENVTDNILMPGLGVLDIAVNPTNANEVYISTGNDHNKYGTGIYKTTDGCNSWQQVLAFDPNEKMLGQRLLINPQYPFIVYALVNGYVYRTTTGGVHWEIIFDQLEHDPAHWDKNKYLKDIEFKPNDYGTVYISSVGIKTSTNPNHLMCAELWKTHNAMDATVNWQRVENDLPDFTERIGIAVSPHEPDRLFIGYTMPGNYNGQTSFYLKAANYPNYAINDVFSREDFWSSYSQAYSGLGYFAFDMEISPTDPSIMYLGGYNLEVLNISTAQTEKFYNVYTSSNPYFHVDQRVFKTAVSNGNTYLFCGNDGGVSRYDWENDNMVSLNGTGLDNLQYFGIANSDMQPDFHIGGTQDNGEIGSHTGNWFRTNVGDSYENIIDPVEPNIVYCTANGGSRVVKKSSTFGAYFTNINNGLNIPINNGYGLNDRPFLMSSHDRNTLFIGYHEVYKTTDGGGNWIQFTDFHDANYVVTNAIRAIALSKSNPDVMYVGYDGATWAAPGVKSRLFRSSDGGVTWIDLTTSIDAIVNGHSITDIRISDIEPNKVWLSFGSFQDNNGTAVNRVLYSSNAGSSWIDITDNLPNLPVNCLQGIMFDNKFNIMAGTDFGIYIHDKNQGNWINISNGLPLSLVTDIEVNYSENELRVATFGRGIWKTKIPCILFGSDIHIVVNNENWDTDKIIANNIYIEPNRTLEITARISLTSNARIIVKPGAKLIIDAGKLTNACNETWPGIEVWGNSSSHQYADANGNYQQGYVELKNGAVIENAWEAIRPWNPDHWDETGGIIKADGATFKNNHRAIEFISYENFDPQTGEHRPNQSVFKNCTFETTYDFDELFGESTFLTFVSMFNVDGVKFYACDFEDARTDFYDPEPDNQSVGIWTIDANFYVLPICNDNLYDCWNCTASNITPSTFTGLNRGVYSSQSSTNNTFVIDRVDFTNNLIGILNCNNNHASCIRSTFNVGTKEITPPFYMPIGIYNYASTGFSFDQNNFSPDDNLPTLINFHTGIWNLNTGHDENIIFKNNFTDMGYANVAIFDNHNNYWPEKGLIYKCNTNINNVKFDFYTLAGEGIASYQGTAELAAGNTFCHNTTPAGSDFANRATWPVNYYYYEGNPDEDPINTINVWKQGAPQNLCNEKYSIGSDIKLTEVEKEFYRQQYYFNKVEYDNTKYLYEDLRDGGDTPGTKLDIENAWPDETWELRAQLLANSPHLSLKVLYAAADQTDVLPHTIMFEICIANPEEMRNEEFLNYLETKDDPMPSYMVDNLRSEADADTYKSVLQNEMARYIELWGDACNNLIRDIVLDSTGIEYDTLRLWLGNKESLNGAYEIINTYIAQNNLFAALNYLYDIPNNFDLTDEQLTEYNYLFDLKTVLISAQQKGRNILQLDSLEVLDLVIIADTSKFIAGAEAQSILNFGYGYSYFILPDLPNEPNMKQSKVVENNNGEWIKANNENHFIEAFPNPASTWVTFEYTLPYQVGIAKIEIIDISGKPVKIIEVEHSFGQITWDTRNVKTGLYIYSLKVNNNTIDQRKLIINNK